MSFDVDLDDEHIREAMDLRSRHPSEEQIRKFEGYMAEIFTTFGLDLNTPATTQTPRLVPTIGPNPCSERNYNPTTTAFVWV